MKFLTCAIAIWAIIMKFANSIKHSRGDFRRGLQTISDENPPRINLTPKNRSKYKFKCRLI